MVTIRGTRKLRRSSTADKALSLAKKNQKQLVSSAKEKTYDGTGTVNQSGVMHNLNTIAEGTGEDEREGQAIKLKSISLRYVARSHNSSSNTLLRLILVRDTQQVIDTAPTPSMILQSVGGSPSADNPILAHYNVSQNKRFVVKMDRVVTVSDGTIQQKFGQAYIKCGTNVLYNGAATSDIQKGGYYLLVISNEATNLPSVNLQYRMQWYD